MKVLELMKLYDKDLLGYGFTIEARINNRIYKKITFYDLEALEKDEIANKKVNYWLIDDESKIIIDLEEVE